MTTTAPELYDFEVRNRFTSKVQFTAKIEADPSVPFGIRLGLAVKWGLANKAYLTGADLTGADLTGAYLTGAYLAGANLAGANLAGAYLTGADLTGAYLTGADLTGADLTGADLTGVYLTRANLAGANLAGALIKDEVVARLFASVQRLEDPYTFHAFELEVGGVKIMAGCRWFTLSEFTDHVAVEYPDTPKAAETLAILDFIAARAKSLGITVEVAQ